MTDGRRPIWTEGMFLGPQHFQQHDRYLHTLIAQLARADGRFGWGFSRLELDTEALAEGRIALRSASGMFPDGTPFHMPEHDDLPAPFTIDVDVRDRVVSLAIPLTDQSDKEIATETGATGLSRYLLGDQRVGDRHTPDSDTEETVFTARLWTRLVLDEGETSSWHTIPIGRVVERRDDGVVRLDPDSYPCAMRLAASPPLSAFCRELAALLAQRAGEIAARLGTPDASDSTQFAAFSLLQILNRSTPLLQHVAQAAAEHPERLFRDLVQLAGELATITDSRRVAGDPIEYLHRDQHASFLPLITRLRTALNWIPESTTEAIPVRHVKAGIHTAEVLDRSLFDGARFVLAVKARSAPEELARRFPRQTTISSKQRLRDLVQAQSQGVELRPVVTVPSSIPVYERFVYFDLHVDNPLWSEIARSGVIAMHVAGNLADLQMQIWALRR